MHSRDVLIGELDRRFEELEERWCLPWYEERQAEPVWRHALVNQVESLDDAGFDQVVSHLVTHPSFALRGISLHLISRRGRVVLLDHVREGLSDPSLHVRAVSAMAIGTLHDVEGVELLLDTRDGEHPEVKKAIVDALRAVGDTRCIPLVARWVGRVGEDDELRRKACQALGSIGDDAAMPVLARVLEDETVSGEVRRDAAVAIGRIGGDEACQLLASALSCGRHRVQSACLAALGVLADRSLLGAVGDLVVSGADPAIRVAALQLLGELADPQALRPLQVAAQDPLPAVRAAASETLGRLGGPRARVLLRDMLADREPAVLASVLRAYGAVVGVDFEPPAPTDRRPDRDALASSLARARAHAGRSHEGLA